jgi:hypothetical protein
MKPWAWVLVALAAMILLPVAVSIVLGTVFWLVKVAIVLAVIIFLAGMVLRLLGVRN